VFAIKDLNIQTLFSVLFLLVIPISFAVDITLVPGWNFISPPYSDFSVDISGCSSAEVIPAIYHYNPTTENYDTINAISDMKPGLGYWAYLDSSQNCNIVFSGTKAITTADLGENSDGKLVAGWNHVGGTTDSTQLTSDTGPSSKGTCEIGVIYGYNPKTGEYAATETISAGNAYWVYVEKTCQLASEGYSLLTVDSNPQMASVVIFNESGYSFTTAANLTPFKMILPHSNYSAAFIKEGYYYETEMFELNSSNYTLSVQLYLIPPQSPVSTKINLPVTKGDKGIDFYLNGKKLEPGTDGITNLPELEPFEIQSLLMKTPDGISYSVEFEAMNIQDSLSGNSNSITGAAVTDSNSAASCSFPSPPKLRMGPLIIDLIEGVNDKSMKDKSKDILSAKFQMQNLAEKDAPIEAYFKPGNFDPQKILSLKKEIFSLPAKAATATEKTITTTENPDATSFVISGKIFSEQNEEIQDHSATVYSTLQNPTDSNCVKTSAAWPDIEINFAKPLSSQSELKGKIKNVVSDQKKNVYTFAESDNKILMYASNDGGQNWASSEVPMSFELSRVHELHLSGEKGDFQKYYPSLSEASTCGDPRILGWFRFTSSGSCYFKVQTKACKKEKANSCNQYTDMIPMTQVWEFTPTVVKRTKTEPSIGGAVVDSKGNVHIFYSSVATYDVSLKKLWRYEEVDPRSGSWTETVSKTARTNYHVIYYPQTNSFGKEEEIESYETTYLQDRKYCNDHRFNKPLFIDSNDKIYSFVDIYDCDRGWWQFTNLFYLEGNVLRKISSIPYSYSAKVIPNSKGNLIILNSNGNKLEVQTYSNGILSGKNVIGQSDGIALKNPKELQGILPGDIGTTILGVNLNKDDSACVVYSGGNGDYFYANIALGEAQETPELLLKQELLRTQNTLSGFSMLSCNDITYTDNTEQNTYLLKSFKSFAYNAPEIGWFRTKVGGQNGIINPSGQWSQSLNSLSFSEYNYATLSSKVSAINFPKLKNTEEITGNADATIGAAERKAKNVYVAIIIGPELDNPAPGYLTHITYTQGEYTAKQFRKRCPTCKVKLFSYQNIYNELNKKNPTKPIYEYYNKNTFREFNSYLQKSYNAAGENDVIFPLIMGHGSEPNSDHKGIVFLDWYWSYKEWKRAMITPDYIRSFMKKDTYVAYTLNSCFSGAFIKNALRNSNYETGQSLIAKYDILTCQNTALPCPNSVLNNGDKWKASFVLVGTIGTCLKYSPSDSLKDLQRCSFDTYRNIYIEPWYYNYGTKENPLVLPILVIPGEFSNFGAADDIQLPFNKLEKER